MKDSNWNLLVSVMSLALNLFYFLPITTSNIFNSGGPFGFGFLVLFFTIPLNILMIPAILSFTKKYRNFRLLFYINFFTLITLTLIYAYLEFMQNN